MTPQRLFGRRAAPPSDGHRAALEAELLARWGELHPQSKEERTMVTTMGWRAAVVAGLLAVAGGASQAPADVKAEIGKRIEVVSDAPLGPPAVRALVDAFQAGGRRFEVRVQVHQREVGPAVTTVDLFGDTVALADVEATARRAVPALAGKQVTVTAIERQVPGTLGDAASRLVGREKHLSPEALKAAIAAELQAAEPGAQVDVQVEEEGGKRKVRVEVRREEHEAAPRPQAK